MTHIAGEDARNYRIEARSQDLPPDAKIHQLIQPYQSALQAEMDQVIGTVEKELTKGTLESTLGNWVADAVYEYAERISGANYSFGLCNSGGIRVPSIGKGSITKRKIFELMPFDNYLVVTRMKGTILKQLFDRMADYGGWPVSGGVRFSIQGGMAIDISIDGKDLDPSKEYDVVLSDYLSEGGSDCHFLEDLAYENLNVYYRDALIEQVKWLTKKGAKVDANIEGRVKTKD